MDKKTAALQTEYDLLKRRYMHIAKQLHNDTDAFSPLHLLHHTEAAFLGSRLKRLKEALNGE